MISPLPSPLPSAELGGVGESVPPDDAGADGAERRRHPRIRLDEIGIGAAATSLRSAERRPSAERRAAGGGLRDNVGWTVAHGTDKRLGGLRKMRVKTSRIFVLGVAVIAGGFAFYLSSQAGSPSAPAVTAVAPQATVQVLVASQHVAAGQRLSQASLTWQDWPEKALQSDYITAAAAPSAMTDLPRYMARSEILPGDPIRRQKLTEGAGGYLSAALEKGMRGVSVTISAESASGGFISPNDRVDVVLTYTPPAAGIAGSVPRSITILRNVRVLAINSNAVEPGSLGPPPDEQRDNTFAGQAIATLALRPADADLVLRSAALGKLSLLLRASVEAAVGDTTARAQDSANQAIRMTSPFWLQ